MINFPKPPRLLSQTSSEMNQADPRFTSLSLTHLDHLKYWRVRCMVTKDVFNHFWLSRKSKKIIHDSEVSDMDDLEIAVARSFVTVPLLFIIFT